jgi:glutamine synthetase
MIFPAANEYLTKVAESVNALTAVSSELNTSAQRDLVKELSIFTNKLREASKVLSDKVAAVEGKGDVLEQAKECRRILLENMSEVREFADKLELIVDSKIWPLPTYEDLLFKL